MDIRAAAPRILVHGGGVVESARWQLTFFAGKFGLPKRIARKPRAARAASYSNETGPGCIWRRP